MDWKEQAKLAVIREAGNLPDGVTEVAKFVVQEWSSLNERWMDGPSEAYDTEDKAAERETEISGWEHVGRTRIVHRTVTVTERVIGGPQRLLDDWLSKARLVRRLGPDERWPAWSTGEVLAVAVILNDTAVLEAMEYTLTEALDRLRYDIQEPTVAGAAAAFNRLREQLEPTQ